MTGIEFQKCYVLQLSEAYVGDCHSGQYLRWSDPRKQVCNQRLAILLKFMAATIAHADMLRSSGSRIDVKEDHTEAISRLRSLH